MADYGAFDRTAGTTDFSSTDVYCCRIIVSHAHKLIQAYVFIENTVLTGDLEIFLQKVDRNDARTGAQVGGKLENIDINGAVAVSGVHTKVDFVLGSDDVGVAPANRCYMLKLTSTNSADRFEEPHLVIKTQAL